MGEQRFRKSFQLAARMITRNCEDTIQIGHKLTEVGADELVAGGYVILSDSKIYISPKFGLISGYGKGLGSSSEFLSLIPIDVLKEYKNNIERNESFFQKIILPTKSGKDILLYCDIIPIKNFTIIGINKIKMT